MPRHGRTAAAALAVLACLAAPALAAGDVDSMVLAGGRVGLDTPAELSLAVTPEQLLTDASPPPCREGFDYCLYLPAEAYAGTNLRSAGLAVTRREDLRAPASCLLAQPDGWSGLQPGVVYEGPGSPVATSRFGDVGEGAAGSYTLGEVLRLYDGVQCWELETRLALTRFENYPPGRVEEFSDADRADVERLLWSVLDSAVVAGEPVVWPREGTGDLSAFVRVELPAEATSPLVLRGEARGVWFFEGSFPVALLAEDGTELARGFVTADGDWMTEEFVPFEGELAFEVTGPTPAVLVLMRDNPSDLPEHDAAARYELTLR
ncbi:MAG TPA: Gmad2 immunoglobulin-like domain-containing protein [Trueperaceae bacterium]|jgi:hypothetical protein|nr:Gmad2 immunoglobulin-like domain-containing protein [Trueperaceae bacterium]